MTLPNSGCSLKGMVAFVLGDGKGIIRLAATIKRCGSRSLSGWV